MANGKAKLSSSTSRLTTAAFEQYSIALHRYVLRRARRPEDVPDLTQEIFERFLKKRDRPEVVRNPLAYLFGIATHVVGEALYEERRSRVTYDSELVDTLDEGFNQALPDELSEQLGIRRDLIRALSELPQNHLTALLLVEGEEMSYEEAARASGFTRNTIATYVMHARAKLKIFLKDYWRSRE